MHQPSFVPQLHSIVAWCIIKWCVKILRIQIYFFFCFKWWCNLLNYLPNNIVYLIQLPLHHLSSPPWQCHRAPSKIQKFHSRTRKRDSGGGKGQRGLKHGMFTSQVSGPVAHMWEYMPCYFRLSDTFRMCRSNNITVFMNVRWIFDFCNTHWF